MKNNLKGVNLNSLVAISAFSLVLLAFFTQTALALDTVQTKYGRLEVKTIGEFEKGLFLGSKVLLKKEGGYLDIEKVLHVGNSEIVLVSYNMGGSGTVNSYFFVNLMPNSKPILSEYFWAQKGEINPIQKGNKITIDLGYNDGAHEILTYQNGKQLIQKIWDAKKTPANEDDCNYLYNQIYVFYVQNQKCNEPPEEVSGMSSVRGYIMISNDPHFNLKQLQNLSKTSCKKGDLIKYSEFKKKVCGGR